MEPVCQQYFTVDGDQYLKSQGQRHFIRVIAKELESIRRPYVACDGNQYTFKEFVDYFGRRHATKQWEAARDCAMIQSYRQSEETLSTKCEAPQENAESGINVVVLRESSAIVLTLENTDLHNVEFSRIKEVAANHIRRLETHVTYCLQEDDLILGCR